jgi:nicotinic acid mononucleotide adenylyltransferase
MSSEQNNSLFKALLDSSLISQTNKFQYDIKVINCNGYIHLYIYPSKRLKQDNNWCAIDTKKKFKPLENTISNNNHFEPKYTEIRSDNAMRSKISLERLIKANIEAFKTFLTLTFADNVSSIKEANKILNIWLTRARKSHKDLKYICVPEYQKRGAVHYHLITNLDLNSDLIKLQANKTNQYDVLYWDNGFSSVFGIKDVNIVGYLSKYMTKDIDNRLFNKKRYFYSTNLKIPKTEYINTEDDKAMQYLFNLLKDKKIKYSNTYYTKIDNCPVKFYELTSYNI